MITLGIIGVVGAMTIPTLMTKYAKQRTETQLVKFYSMMNQTLRMSVAENGDPDGWIIANKNYTYDETVEFLKTYIFPYMKNLGYKDCSFNGQIWVCVTLIDGGIATFSIDINGGDITYYNDEKYVNNRTLPNISRHKFRFQMAKVSGVDNVTNSVSYIEPYIYSWTKTKDDLINNSRGCKPGCTNCDFCTEMIQMNSWKIPPNYPW